MNDGNNDKRKAREWNAPKNNIEKRKYGEWSEVKTQNYNIFFVVDWDRIIQKRKVLWT